MFKCQLDELRLQKTAQRISGNEVKLNVSIKS